MASTLYTTTLRVSESRCWKRSFCNARRGTLWESLLLHSVLCRA